MAGRVLGAGRARRTLETAVVTSAVESQRHGRWSATILGLIGEVGGFALVALGHDGMGIAAIITATAGLAGVFIYGRWRAEKDQAEKRDTLAQEVARRQARGTQR